MVAPAISLTRAVLSMGLKAASSPKGIATLTALGFAPATIEAAVDAIKNKKPNTVEKPTPTSREEIKARIKRENEEVYKTDRTKKKEESMSPVSESSVKTNKKRLSEFGQAFSDARKAGKKEFEYKGKKYHTRTKEEESARTTKKARGGKVGKPRGVGCATRGYGKAMMKGKSNG